MMAVGNPANAKQFAALVKQGEGMGVLKRPIPDKPRSRMQRYRTTEAGLAMATDHAPGRPPVFGPLPLDSSRKGGPNRTRKSRGQR